jgi:hypothetical protein
MIWKMGGKQQLLVRNSDKLGISIQCDCYEGKYECIRRVHASVFDKQECIMMKKVGVDMFIISEGWFLNLLYNSETGQSACIVTS